MVDYSGDRVFHDKKLPSTEKVLAYNNLKGFLRPGQKIVVPTATLKDAMKAPTVPAVAVNGDEYVDLDEVRRDLKYTQRNGIACAMYEIKLGEAIYSAAVVRFTDRRENADIIEASNQIAKLSGIKDLRDIDVGTDIYIPVEMLSARFKPLSHPDRQSYESNLRKAHRQTGCGPPRHWIR